MPRAPQRLILCAGLQSSGSTLASWCFLQRADTDGLLDMENDVIHTSFERAQAPVVWVKMTIGSFRWLDIAESYRDLGWAPEPLLVVRDVRAVYASLRGKTYGFDGLTAEEPPLRMRFRRFLLDWKLFQERRWPVLEFERLVSDPEPTLADACSALRLPFDSAMLTWPKRFSDVAYVLPEPNRTFAASVAAGSLAAALAGGGTTTLDAVPEAELRWLEETFADFNEAHGYPRHVDHSGSAAPAERPKYRTPPRRALQRDVEQLRLELLLKLDVEPVVPAGGTFVLVDNGVARSYDGGRRSLPFPERDGVFDGHPESDAAAIAELERLRGAGAGFVVFPANMRYWLDAYPGLRDQLERRGRRVRETDRGLVYELR